MNRFYLATVIAALVTMVLAVNLLVVGMRGSAMSARPARLRLCFQRARRRLKHVIDVTVAAMLANRERRATTSGGNEWCGRGAAGGRSR